MKKTTIYLLWLAVLFFPFAATSSANIDDMASSQQGWVNISGFDDANNEGLELIVFGDLLYAVMDNEVTGIEVWRYEGGATWTQVNSDGFGDGNNIEYEDFILFNNTFYISTNNEVSGSEVWRYDGGTAWTRVDPGTPGPGNGSFGDLNNCDYEFAIFNDTLYLSTENEKSGVEIWRYDGGTAWTRVDPGAPGPGNGGFGYEDNAEASLQEYNGSLYASTLIWGNGWPSTGIEVWRYDGGTAWTRVDPGTPGPGNGGFGDIYNLGSRLFVFDDTLFDITFNASTGVEVWSYEGGTSWTQVNTDGFGKGSDNLDIEDCVAYNGSFHVGTLSWSTQGEIWRYDGGTTWTDMTPPWDVNNEAAYDFLAHNGNLYVGTSNYSTGGEVWEFDGTVWSQINIDGFGNPGNEEIELTLYHDTIYASMDNEVWRHSFKGDFDSDGDVDGSDLAILVSGGQSLSLDIFADNFGKTECP